ncbi:MAG: DUF5615 family PIN-like protein [Phycisphaerales bacterium]|nr:DUF5615 family PIN-like protein [Phycisphaerales bacterium]
MKGKTDENLHPEVAECLRQSGHDAVTVWDQHLQGSADDVLAQVCCEECRALFTLDADFADIRRYPPDEYAGLVVLRPGSQSRRHAPNVVQRVLPLLETLPLDGRLWIVDETGVRVRGDAD